ncbi:MAG: 16S rRNA (guanine(527)-N(7))-methyltransferase RsmG [Acidobacteriaceae bacterium]
MTPSNRHPDPAMQADEIEALVRPMLLQPLPPLAYGQLALYMALLERWNRRMNLTAIRDPRELVQLHIGESLRCAQLLPPEVATVMDFGSGAGLPGVPIQIARPEIAVVLAESQKKKANFLREMVRSLHLSATVHAGRVEDMPQECAFDVVTLRAVDKMEAALLVALPRVAANGWAVVLTSLREAERVTAVLPDLAWGESHRVPGSNQRVVLMGHRVKP